MLNKKLFKFILIIGIMIVFNFSSCDLINPLNGTWVSDNQYSPGVYSFNGSNYEFIYYPHPKNNNHKGTFSLNSDKTKITFKQTHSGEPWSPAVRSFERDINISGNSFTMGTNTYSKK